MSGRRRDVEVIRIGGDQCLVVACDSCGAVGSKELDAVQAPAYVVGRYTARVALFEVLAAGAQPRAASVAISNEPSPTGDAILHGVRDELSTAGADDIPIAASTEKNMATRQTSVGVTVIGVCGDRELRLGLSRPGDAIYCMGVPKVGHEVGGPEDDRAVQRRHLDALLKREGIHDIIPVGSKGIRWEAGILADAADAHLIIETDPGLDLEKSAGPSSCIVFSCQPDTVLPEFDFIPFVKIGKLG